MKSNKYASELNFLSDLLSELKSREIILSVGRILGISFAECVYNLEWKKSSMKILDMNKNLILYVIF